MRCRAYAFRPGTPPAEIQLWKSGDNPTDYGVHRWTERSAQLVGEAYASRGNPLQIDVEHNNGSSDDTKPKTGEPGPTGGYAQLEIRGDGPHLVFAWSAYAVDQIATRQRLFLSPDYSVDKSTGEIIGLNRVSLVADPGTHNARMLAARAGAGGKGMDPTTKMLIAALKVALGGKDPKASIKQAFALLAELGGGGADAPAAPADGAAGAGDDAGAGDAAAAAKPAAAPGAPAAGDGAGDEGEEEDEEAKKAAAKAEASKVAARAATARPPAAKPAVTAEETELAKRVAVLEAERLERETEERFTASSARIPASLHAFAKRIAHDQEAFEAFVAGLPEAKGGIGGVRAGARTRGEGQGENATGGRPPLPVADKAHMERVFASANRPEDSVQPTRSGGVRLTHLARPKAAPVTAGKPGSKEA